MEFEDKSPRDSNVVVENRYDEHSGGKEHPCAGCQTLDCHSIHGLVRQECLLKSCYVCTDRARIDKEITSIYDRLADLVRERQENIAKTRHDCIINRLPVEILSEIFVFVRDAIIDIKLKRPLFNYDCPYQQPSQSPPLLVGAVCKRWRDITLETPRLWTDIIINLNKYADEQLEMIKNWALRSGAIPLDIAIYGSEDDDVDVVEEYEEVLAMLRSLVPRWHDIALHVPRSFFHQLLNNLQDIPPINTLYIEITECQKPTLLQHPLLPRRFIYKPLQETPQISVEWNRLVFIDIEDIDQGEMLHIIRTAPNLRHCIGMGEDCDIGKFPFPTTPITNHSLLYLETSYNIMGHLTLPSLRHLDYVNLYNEQQLGSIVEFMHRSRAPLDNFSLRCYIYPGTVHIPPFDRLRWITSLSLECSGNWMPLDTVTIDNIFVALTRPSTFPRLREIDLEVFNLSALSWSMFSTLLRRSAGSKPADNDATSNKSIPLPTPLSRASIRFTAPFTNTMDKITFLRLLEAKKSGVDLTIVGRDEEDLFDNIAKFYEVVL